MVFILNLTCGSNLGERSDCVTDIYISRLILVDDIEFTDTERAIQHAYNQGYI